MLALGVQRVVIGSVAVKKPASCSQWLREFGAERICLAIDVRVDDTGVPRLTHARLGRRPRASLWELLAVLPHGAVHVLCTDIERDGALGGPSFDLYASRSRRFPTLQWQASGGISAGADLQRLAATGPPRSSAARPCSKTASTRRSCSHTCRRLIPCLDVRDGQVVKGVQFRDHRVVGDILELAARYRDEGADELVFYDITASPRGPLGRPQLDQPRRRACSTSPSAWPAASAPWPRPKPVLNAGAEKISVNSPALADPALIDALARRFGSQCVVVGIDSQTAATSSRSTSSRATRTAAATPAGARWNGSRKSRSAAPARSCSTAWPATACARGYDLPQLLAVRAACNVPLVASGGAGAPEHFAALFARG